ncbi:dTDP-glucose 4,6-dehydratase [Sulfoacidibacillus thermotolerans]|uniref:dTDP-glucose 4,6-dehydratase n=1 Tax=Sulfoacidibacillus thermotolerans TaxID=1765684 RepID=A0A2U3D666_SULT2|nr:dTDP-glucose 4,6-dehydratase [Sulfoacidibacillus thermotolerans]PWI56767.1 dTDP-glucose 4,6-dehydratase [Sulfoacidibacillus thermotolerans]
MKLLVTGGYGFIGSNYIRYVLQQHKDVEVVNVDALTYAASLATLQDLTHEPRYQFVHADITAVQQMEEVFAQGVDVVVNFAAESHVDRSILDPSRFVKTNVLGTQVLLDAARKHGVQKFVQVSTDEVYGTLGNEGYFTEETPLAPNSPYSASKAAADLLVRAYHETYGLPVFITRCSNNYGPYQFPEKLIPLMIIHALEDRPLPVYGDGQNVRDWLHVKDHCAGIDAVVARGKPGEVYNIGGHNERTNLVVVQTILQALGKPASLIRFVQDRPGHDRRYAMDPTKIQRELAWQPKYTFEAGIRETIQWYLSHRSWWEAIRDGSYQAYYQQQYGERLGDGQ